MSSAQLTMAEFQEALVDYYKNIRSTADMALRPIAICINIFSNVTSDDESKRDIASSMIGELVRLYYWIISHDRGYDPKDKVFMIKREHMPTWTSMSFEEAQVMWPVMPMLIDLQTEIKHIRTFDPSISERRARIVQAKLAEYIMAHICTKPNIFTPHIGSYARWVISMMAKKYPPLKDPLKVADIADKVLLSLERRTRAVTRYTARAQNMHQAAKNVAMYMRKAIRRRFYDYVESEVSALPSKPVSTMRRWKNKDKIDVTNIAAAESLMRARKSGVQPGRVSVNQLSKWSKLSRGAVGRALARAEAKHGFSAERFRNNIAQLTPEQVKWVKKELPPPRGCKTKGDKKQKIAISSIDPSTIIAKTGRPKSSV